MGKKMVTGFFFLLAICVVGLGTQASDEAWMAPVDTGPGDSYEDAAGTADSSPDEPQVMLVDLGQDDLIRGARVLTSGDPTVTCNAILPCWDFCGVGAQYYSCFRSCSSSSNDCEYGPDWIRCDGGYSITCEPAGCDILACGGGEEIPDF